MLSVKDRIQSRKILTQRGMIPESMIHKYDKVYEYGTGNWLEVTDVGRKPVKELYAVHYSDGIVELVCDNELIRLGDTLYYPRSLFDYKTERKKIEMYQVEFYKEVHNPVEPDPYIAGALFGYGDYEKDEIVLPSVCTEAITDLCNQFHLTSTLGNGDNVSFYYNGYLKNKLTWQNLFPHHIFYASRKRVEEPAIPKDYMYGTSLDRIRFIRGLFDAGYSYKDSPDNVSIAHWSKDRLEWFRWILWSLGILSKITYDTSNSRGWEWKLEIIDKYNSYPGFFYKEPYIANMVDTDNRLCKTDPEFWLTISYIERINNDIPNQLVPHFYFEKENVSMLSDHFRPRISD